MQRGCFHGVIWGVKHFPHQQIHWLCLSPLDTLHMLPELLGGLEVSNVNISGCQISTTRGSFPLPKPLKAVCIKCIYFWNILVTGNRNTMNFEGVGGGRECLNTLLMVTRLMKKKDASKSPTGPQAGAETPPGSLLSRNQFVSGLGLEANSSTKTQTNLKLASEWRELNPRQPQR